MAKTFVSECEIHFNLLLPMKFLRKFQDFFTFLPLSRPSTTPPPHPSSSAFAFLPVESPIKTRSRRLLTPPPIARNKSPRNSSIPLNLPETIVYRIPDKYDRPTIYHPFGVVSAHS
jgi:hypothetical protein